MNTRFNQARDLLKQFKGDHYVHGLGCFERLGALTAGLGKRVSVVADGCGTAWGTPLHARVTTALRAAGVELAGELIPGAGPNAPREDVRRIADAIASQSPAAVLAVGGGSVLDATKAACALVALGDKYPDIEAYFGMGAVTAKLNAEKRTLLPLMAVQLAASSGAHLTKYANITDQRTHQKKLIVDDAIVPRRALFDYGTTTSMPPGFTADGGLDGISHCLEVFFGLKGEALERVRPVALLGIELVAAYVKRACDHGADLEAREALGLGTDLGGYAIMIGGTNGAHLTSFSLVDILSHGRACALMNPYYTVFFAPAVEPQLREVGAVLKAAGQVKTDLTKLHGRDLGVAVAEGLLALSRAINFPTRLADVEGFTREHIQRALAAAKNPQLEMKLKNMPVPLTAAQVDDYMGPILEAAVTGDFSGIRNLA
jgi:alcohol dehydrogenase class IV